jgi:hypothetical protein
VLILIIYPLYIYNFIESSFILTFHCCCCGFYFSVMIYFYGYFLLCYIVTFIFYYFWFLLCFCKLLVRWKVRKKCGFPSPPSSRTKCWEDPLLTLCAKVKQEGLNMKGRDPLIVASEATSKPLGERGEHDSGYGTKNPSFAPSPELNLPPRLG